MKATPQLVIAAILTVVVAAVLAAAAVVLDGPGLQRQRRLDERRTRDLDQLSEAVNAWYSTHKQLPPDLTVLFQGRVASASTADPVSSAPYEYLPGAQGQYRLCAVFSEAAGRTYRYGPEWSHGTGRFCFTLDAAQR